MPDMVVCDDAARIIDISGAPQAGPDHWPAIKIAGERIDEAVERLADVPLPADGRRSGLIVHPRSTSPGLGLAPGIDVTINVLRPGEKTSPLQRNSGQVELCIRGAGIVRAGETAFTLAKWGVCNIPSMQPYHHDNTGDDLWVRLSYSNAPLLAKLGVHYADAHPVEHSRTAGGRAPNPQAQDYTRRNAPDTLIAASGARLRGYEFLTDIEVVENHVHHWPWDAIAEHVALQLGDNKRHIVLLYNPATERRNGTSHCFFVTCASVPPGSPPRKVGRGHRHSSVAINYHYKGSGYSIVGDQKIDWKAGDLLLSAPGWREHAHYPGPDGSGTFTVQDHPLQIAMESLIWQERMEGPILALGSEAGQTGYVAPRLAGA